MTKINKKLTLRQISYGFLALLMTVMYFPNMVSAAPITLRKVVIGSSVPSANTTYDFTFTLPTSTTVKSMKFQACDAASVSCTQTGAANGFASTPSAIGAAPTGLGSAGTWTADVTDATSLRIKNTSNTGAPGAAVVHFTNVKNPSATNATFFIQMTSYSDDAWTTPIDTGSVAASTAGQITVTATVNEALTFTLAAATVPLGVITSATTGTGTSTMTVGTNASTGYSVSYAGSTLTANGGANTITAMAAAAGSTQNSKQFGINLMTNTTPAVGAGVTGVGTGTASTGYNTANQFKFVPAGEVVASAGAATNNNVFTTSYIANVDTATAAGQYSTAITYTATANF